jgi:hypothetical protein
MAGGIILKRIRHDLIASRSLDRALPPRQAEAGRNSAVAIVIHSAMRIVDVRELHIFANHDSERYAPVETEMMADRVDFREIERDSKREEPSSWNSDEALAWRRRSWRFYRHHSEIIELTPAGSVHEQAPHQVERGVHDRLLGKGSGSQPADCGL